MSKKMAMRLLQTAIYGINTFYEGEGDPPVVPPVVPPNASDIALNPATNKPWTKAEFQAEVNRQQKEERIKQQEKNKKTVEDLEALKNKTSTSDEDKATLQRQIDDLTTQMQTKEEQQKTALSKLQEKYEADSKKWTTETNTWKTRFENELFNNQIAIQAEKHGAIRSSQVAALLNPNKKFVEETGSDGKPTGRIIPKVIFRKMDKDGKELALELTVEETLKTMTEIPEEYGNLFKNTAKSGFGQQQMGGGGGSGILNTETIEKMSPEEYEKNRVEILNSATPQGD